MEIRRRRLLQATTTLPVVALAGCGALSDTTPTPSRTPEYEQLVRTPVYVGDDVGFRVPDRIPTVTAPTNADLVVVHANPAVGVEQVVTWLTDDRAVALLGGSAQQTWTEWTQNETYRDTFGAGGRSEADPSPHLLVAAAVDTDATTFRYSWSDLPSNGEILDALEDAMTDIEALTPR
jgi:hypothetical protein